MVTAFFGKREETIKTWEEEEEEGEEGEEEEKKLIYCVFVVCVCVKRDITEGSLQIGFPSTYLSFPSSLFSQCAR